MSDENKTSMKIEATLPLRLTQKKKWVVATCPLLDVSSQGDTEEEALKNLTEAIDLFIVTCIETGTLDQVLRECGFEKKGTLKKPRTDNQSATRYLPISIPLLGNKPGDENSCLV